MNEKQLLALAKKNAAKAAERKAKQRPVYDQTVEATRASEPVEGEEAAEIFAEMKRREF
jgi:hypothetical protein